MTYTKQTWADLPLQTTPITAAALQHIEDGLEQVSFEAAIHSYRWADAAARTAQTGMSNGDQGLQVDTDVRYKRVSGSWVTGQCWTFIWADAAARAAQTGMAKGDLGFQSDTGVFYWRSASAWMQQTRVHAEYTYSQSVPNATATTLTTPTLAAGTSSAAAGTFFTPKAGGLTLALAGDYLVYFSMGGIGSTGRTFFDINTPTIWRTGLVVPEDRASGSIAYRNASPATDVTFSIYQTSGGSATVSGRIHVDYLGLGA